MPWGIIASIGGALLSSGSASDAADSQAAGTAAATAENKRQFDLTRNDYAPGRNIGNNALRRLAALYGLSDGGAGGGGSSGGGMSEADIRNMLAPQFTTGATQDNYREVGGEGMSMLFPGSPGTVNQAGLDAAVQQRMAQQQGASSGAVGGTPQTYNDGLDAPIQMDPGYQFGLDQGNQALDRKVAAAGGRVSGAALKGAQRFGVDYATTGYSAAYGRRQDRLNRLQALAGIGQTATAGSAQAGQAAAGANSALYSAQGNAAGAASLAQGNIWQSAGNQLGAMALRSGGSSGWSPNYTTQPMQPGGGY
jgi:hypothetical protein